MTTSENVDKIFPALIKAQSEMGKAKKTSNNPFFKSKYADLSEMIDVTKESLTANGMAVIQSPGGNGSQISVTARIIHESGQWIEDTLTLNATKNDPQQAGSAITYARRYQLAALFNIAQEDDDGNGSSGDEDAEYIDLKKQLEKHIKAGNFDHPENVEKVISERNVSLMRKALESAKSKETK